MRQVAQNFRSGEIAIAEVSAHALKPVLASLRGAVPHHSLLAPLDFSGGSRTSITCESWPAHGLHKEHIEISCGSRIAVVEDFRNITFHSAEGRKRRFLQGKGQKEMLDSVVAGFLSPRGPQPFADAIASTRAPLKLLESASSGFPVSLDS